MRLALALVLAAAVPAFAADPTPMEQAVAAFEAGDYAKTVAVTTKIAADDPARARAYYLAGEAYLLLDDAENAEKSFRAVLEKKPEAVPAIVGLGRALALDLQTEEAEKTLRRAVSLDRKDPAAKRALGEFLLDEGRLKESVKELRAAHKLAPKDPLTCRALVEALLRSDEEKSALKVAGALAKALPKHPMGHFLKGLVLDRKGDDDDAIESYEAAIAQDDAFLDAHKNLAILCTTENPMYRDRERSEKALKHYARYFELGGEDPVLERTYKQLAAFLEQFMK